MPREAVLFDRRVTLLRIACPGALLLWGAALPWGLALLLGVALARHAITASIASPQKKILMV